MSARMQATLTRRELLRMAGIAGGAAMIGACTATQTQPTPAQSAPTAAPATSAPATTAPAAPEPAQSAKKFKVGYTCISWTIPWQVYYKQMFDDIMKKYPNYEIIWHDANFDQKALVDAVEGWIAQKLDMIIAFTLDEVSMIETIKKARAAGIPVMLTMDPPDYRVYDFMTGFSGLNGWDGSRMCVDKFEVILGGKGDLAYITAPKGSASELMYTQGVVDEMNRINSQIKIVAQEDGGWDVNQSYQKASDILTKFPKLNAFYTTDDYMGAGIIRALKEKGYKPGDVKMVVQGGSKQGVSDLKDGWYEGIVDQGPQFCAPQDIWFMRGLLEEGQKLPLFAWVVQEMITKDNVDRFPGTW
jgi:ABC-type sugar transport system substrate-binding protein